MNKASRRLENNRVKQPGSRKVKTEYTLTATPTIRLIINDNNCTGKLHNMH